jgi:hypothetical protein
MSVCDQCKQGEFNCHRYDLVMDLDAVDPEFA